MCIESLVCFSFRIDRINNGAIAIDLLNIELAN